ncbi:MULTISPECIES: permease [Clostridium]|jgi:uncharacterized membrane protein YraQ (UPF0718 family)|uniref:Putative permease n=2 Tax=Clostridium TaxID=1485 RepID=A0A151APF9_9CLOT|nr:MULTISPECIES: permease [Clostridium]KYH29524.1 putative permease [Clostridium colicanis DSM 13634]MBE6043844.1 permease [Clostridium thermopalmarium]PRR72848.1 putative permease [Clostridium thermopalmarium DSM 5974]PVZ21093.1 putative permease [Clostridium thermopalmarium DSM 5974]
MIKNLIIRYKFFIISLITVIIITVIDKEIGVKTFRIAASSFKQMASVLPPIMILLGLMDVWIPRESMMKYMGDNSGILGIGLAILIGSIAAGPMYAAFPFIPVLLRKGVKFSNIIVFMNAWCVTKITTVMFEVSALGYEFTLVRFLVDLPGIIIMGALVKWLMPKNELEELYSKAEEM